jgi:hypothetical protein
MDAKWEIARTVSMLRNLLRAEINSCKRAIEEDNLDLASRELSGVHDKLARAINVLNRLR